MAIEIRRATKADQSAIGDIFRSTFEHTWRPALTPEGLLHARDIDVRFTHHIAAHYPLFYVASNGDKLLGMTHWRENFLHSLHVDQAHQGNGVGGALLRFAIAQIDQHYDEMRLETDTFNVQARAFYKKYGFDEVDTYPDEEWHSGFTTVLMVRAL